MKTDVLSECSECTDTKDEGDMGVGDVQGGVEGGVSNVHDDEVGVGAGLQPPHDSTL